MFDCIFLYFIYYFIYFTVLNTFSGTNIKVDNLLDNSARDSERDLANFFHKFNRSEEMNGPNSSNSEQNGIRDQSILDGGVMNRGVLDHNRDRSNGEPPLEIHSHGYDQQRFADAHDHRANSTPISSSFQVTGQPTGPRDALHHSSRDSYYMQHIHPHHSQRRHTPQQSDAKVLKYIILYLNINSPYHSNCYEYLS